MDTLSQNFSQAELAVRKEIFSLLKTALAKDFNKKLISIDYPPENIEGDYSVPCFILSKGLNKSPADIAKNLSEKIKEKKLISKTVATGPYLNFFVNQQEYSQLVLAEVFKEKDKYGSSQIGKGKKVMVEFFSPNTNKPLTIGHVRNICLGESTSNLLKFSGHKVINATLYNDRGIAIAKTMVGYQKWGQDQTPKDVGMKSDHFVGQFYTRFFSESQNNPGLEMEAKKSLQDWENDDRKVRKVWEKLMNWVLQGFKETLSKLNIHKFDEEYYESEYYDKGKEVVEQGLRKGVFVQDKEGLIFASLEKFDLPNKIVLRPDDTGLYITQDLHLAYLKDQHHLDSSIYVVGSEQDLYIKQLFKILELLGFKNIQNYYHLSYGMIRLPDGKIKSREGLVKGTGADELIFGLEDLAKAEIKKRFNDLTDKVINKRAEQIALGALKFYILAVNPKTTMIFDPKESLAFNGKTGPYLQYVNARINSIFSKDKVKVSDKVDFSVLKDKSEFDLIKLLAKFPKVIDDSVRDYDSSHLANYLYSLAKAFSLFYEKMPILKVEDKLKEARLLLVYDVKIVLETGLDLLGIPAPEKM